MIRTIDLFTAMDKNAGENGKIVVYYVYYHPESTLDYSISVPELCPVCIVIKQRKATRNPVQRRAKNNGESTIIVSTCFITHIIVYINNADRLLIA